MAAIKQVLRFKGLDLIDDADEDTFDKWSKEVEGWSGKIQEIAKYAMTALKEGSDFYAIVDDETDELISICTYSEMSGKADDRVEVPKMVNKKIDYSKYLYVDYIAGNGRGGATEIVKDIMQLAEIENCPLLLQSTEEGFTFYQKMGFMHENRNSPFFFYIPKSLRPKDWDKISKDWSE